jgi:DNA-directed RNA polymerase specialized sigma24 family protein
MGTSLIDDLLRQYVECTDEERAESLFGELVIEHALPGIRKVVRYKLAFQGQGESQDVEDVTSDVMVELLARLRCMRNGAASDGIGSFAGYTAVAAYHACHEYLRRKYPNRHRLKTRLRYLLNTEARFAVWENPPGTWLCGFRTWQEGGTIQAPADAVCRWRESLHDLPGGQNAMPPADLLGRVFERFSGPLEFDELVGMFAHLWGVHDPAPASEKRAREIHSTDTDPAYRIELQRWLAELWAQIRELPRAQRVALLMNLRAGDAMPALSLLPLTGVAGIREISEALEIVPLEFARLWNLLPLDDLAVAALLGVTRQQVINLRKSARERLVRRISGKYRLL